MLLIGGNGFIGRHLSLAAARRGHDLDIVSRTSNDSFFKSKGINCSLYSALEFSQSVSDDVIRRSSKIVYLASKSTLGTFSNEPWKELDLNVNPLFKFLERLTKVNPAAQFVYISSGGTVYGNTDLDSIAESTPLRPISSYGLGKVVAEKIIEYYHTSHNLNYAVLRVANPVGEYHKNIHQGLIPAVFRAILTQKPLPVFGDGNQIRDYLDADDLANAILNVFDFPKAPNRAWNVGAGKGYSTLNVIDMCSEALGETPSLMHRPKRTFDVERIVLDCSDFQEQFQWDARTPLNLTIRKIWKVLKQDKHFIM